MNKGFAISKTLIHNTLDIFSLHFLQQKGARLRLIIKWQAERVAATKKRTGTKDKTKTVNHYKT